MIFIGFAIFLLFLVSTSLIEKTLKSMEKQNERIIELLEEIRDK
ncbi:hypothetical protein J6TS2_23150 [Heyndrickxia sporothermodurans]|nr:hypothetical protein J6TS2_23150 [Heyndrickxia sporothermodurans]